MANFKINFLTNNNTLTLTNCCCPNLIHAVCSDLELAKEYTVYFEDTPLYRAQIFPAKYTFIAEGNIASIDVINGGTGYLAEPTVVVSGGGARKQAVLKAVLKDVSLGDNKTTKTISSITVLDPGIGYTSVPEILIYGGGGRGAIVQPIIGNIVKNLSFFVAFGCDDRKMPIPTPYPSNTPTVTPTNTLTPTPSRL